MGVPLSVKFDNTNDLLDPTRGFRAALLLTPTESLGHANATFTIAQLSGSTYFDLTGGGRTVIATRGLVGKAFGADQFSLPPDQRFYAGGSAPCAAIATSRSGRSSRTATRPAARRSAPARSNCASAFWSNTASSGSSMPGRSPQMASPFTSNWRVGAGIGARYYTSIGPIRLDVAVPLNREPHGDAFELYIGIGQAF